jgi:hypothetical protein
LDRVRELDNAARCAAKSREPAATWIAFTARHIYLIVAAPALDADLMGRALWYAHLFRCDSDYAEFRERRLHTVVLALEAEREVIEWARRHKVRAVVFPVRCIRADASNARAPAGLGALAKPRPGVRCVGGWIGHARALANFLVLPRSARAVNAPGRGR